MNNLCFNPNLDFPLRYFDLSSVSPIDKSRTSQKCTLICKVESLENKKIFNASDATQVLLKDSTGYILANFFNREHKIQSLTKNEEVIVSGVIEEYDSMKCLNNPLIKTYVDGEYSHVIPVYAHDHKIDPKIFEKDTYSRLLFGSSSLTLGKALLSLHGFSSKKELICARHALKLDELVQVHLYCLKTNKTFEDELLNSYKFRLGEKIYSHAQVIYRSQEGEEMQIIKDKLNENKRVFVVCPLANMTAEKRNKKVYLYDYFSKVPEARQYLNISIENSHDCVGNKAGVTKRLTYLKKILNCENIDNLHVCDTISNDMNLCEDDLLIFEDSNRISTLEILNNIYFSKAKTIVVSNSTSAIQKKRMSIFNEKISVEDALNNELKFRRDGDILGVRNEIFKNLRLVNLIRDEKLYKESYLIAKKIFLRS